MSAAPALGSAPDREFLFHVEGPDVEVWGPGPTERLARAAAWRSLTDAQQNAAECMDCVAERDPAPAPRDDRAALDARVRDECERLFQSGGPRVYVVGTGRYGQPSFRPVPEGARTALMVAADGERVFA